MRVAHRIALLALVILGPVLATGGRCGGTNARIFSIAPAEHMLPTSDLYVHGRNFDGAITAALEDPNDPGAALPTPIVTDVEPNIVRLTIPGFTTSRRRFRIRLFEDGTQVPSMRPESSDVYLRSGGGTPPAQSIRLQYISMLEIWSYNSTRGWYVPAPPYSPSLYGVSDSWSSSGWADWRVHVDQASRDWSSICGATWNPGAGQIVSGFAEEAPRASLIWNPYYRLDVSSTSDELVQLYNGLLRSDGTADLPAQGTTLGACQAHDFFQWPNCARFVGNRLNGNTSTVVVVRVRAFMDGPIEVDPNNDVTGYRGLAEPLSPQGTLPGLILISASPAKGMNGPPSGSPPYQLPEGQWEADPARPNTPNLLGHEVVHTVGRLVDEARNFKVQVSRPDESLARGYELDSESPPASHAQNCSIVLNGFGGLDYAR